MIFFSLLLVSVRIHESMKGKKTVHVGADNKSHAQNILKITGHIFLELFFFDLCILQRYSNGCQFCFSSSNFLEPGAGVITVIQDFRYSNIVQNNEIFFFKEVNQ